MFWYISVLHFFFFFFFLLYFFFYWPLTVWQKQTDTSNITNYRETSFLDPLLKFLIYCEHIKHVSKLYFWQKYATNILYKRQHEYIFSKRGTNSNIQFKKSTHNKLKSNKYKFIMTRSSRSNCKTAKSTPIKIETTKRTASNTTPSNNHTSSPKQFSNSSNKSLLEKQQKDIDYLMKKGR